MDARMPDGSHGVPRSEHFVGKRKPQQPVGDLSPENLTKRKNSNGTPVTGTKAEKVAKAVADAARQPFFTDPDAFGEYLMCDEEFPEELLPENLSGTIRGAARGSLTDDWADYDDDVRDDDPFDASSHVGNPKTGGGEAHVGGILSKPPFAPPPLQFVGVVGADFSEVRGLSAREAEAAQSQIYFDDPKEDPRIRGPLYQFPDDEEDWWVQDPDLGGQVEQRVTPALPEAEVVSATATVQESAATVQESTATVQESAATVQESTAAVQESTAAVQEAASSQPQLTPEDIFNLRFLMQFDLSSKRAISDFIKAKGLEKIKASFARFEAMPFDESSLQHIYPPGHVPRYPRESRVYTEIGLKLHDLEQEVNYELALNPARYNKANGLSPEDNDLKRMLIDFSEPLIESTTLAGKITECMQKCVEAVKQGQPIPAEFEPFVKNLQGNFQSAVVAGNSRVTASKNQLLIGPKKGQSYLGGTGLHEFLRVSNRVEAFLFSIGKHPGNATAQKASVVAECNNLTFNDVYERLRVDTASLMFVEMYQGVQKTSRNGAYVSLTSGGHPGAAYRKRTESELRDRLEVKVAKGKDTVAYGVPSERGSDEFHEDLAIAFRLAKTPQELVINIYEIFHMHCYNGEKLPRRIQNSRTVHASGYRLHRSLKEREAFRKEMKALFDKSEKVFIDFADTYNIELPDPVTSFSHSCTIDPTKPIPATYGSPGGTDSRSGTPSSGGLDISSYKGSMTVEAFEKKHGPLSASGKGADGDGEESDDN